MAKPRYEFKVKDKEERDIPIPAPLLERIAARKKAMSEKKLIVGTGAHITRASDALGVFSEVP